MENAVIAMISIAIILSGTMSLMLSSIPSIDTLSTSWKQMTQLAGEMRRTEIVTDNCTVSNEGVRVEVIIRNDGEISLGDFNSWDVVINYSSDNGTVSRWLPYTLSIPPENNRWTISEFRFNGSAETIEPNILNPGEDMKILMQLNPGVAVNTTNRVTISTPNGVAAQAIFQRGGT